MSLDVDALACARALATPNVSSTEYELASAALERMATSTSTSARACVLALLEGAVMTTLTSA